MTSQPSADRLTRRHAPSARGVLLGISACLVSLVSLVALAACASSPSHDDPGSTTSPYGALITSAVATATAAASNASGASDDSGSWRTISESSVSSVSMGGGSNSSVSQSSVSVHGAYRVLAACGGSGSLAITLNPGGALTVRCTSDDGDPVRIAGSDTPPAGGSLSLSVRPSGDVEDADILIQERV